MIQPDQIRRDALRWYYEFLSKSVEGQPFFPKDIRFGKVKPSDTLKEFSTIRKEIEYLYQNSKESIGYGYRIEFVKIKNQKIGEQSFPARIFFEDQSDYLRYIRKGQEFEKFIKTSEKIIAEFPELKQWIINNPQKIIDNFGKWDDLIKVCNYFVKNPKPHIYVRELPLDISTKFVETNQTILRALLDILIERHVNADETNFEKRFNLKYNEKLIRVRILDKKISHDLFSGVDDISIPQSQFDTLKIPCKRVFVLENRTNFSNIFNFLTLPDLAESIAIFGKGFQIGLLKSAEWLSDKQIAYWGDIDAHGFQILSQIRGYFPQTQSCMMDFETFNAFKDLSITGIDTKVSELDHLNPEEHQLFTYLLNQNERNRLEQEKIPHSYAIKKILEITKDNL
ncbi:Wadjet anti-phage system protein JetD domain-containing protein [Methanocalculus sp.]|uniref:Wadjet anti-phage system protein JetD domain-containing protein n=1 Tax=Methanocalculus sp. TaxID=2004547 RepID=UPI0026076F7C|nr:Wadjet anti-phage system protein JetD domain-containing protein [Methanocalculus sp.]MDG6250919.1 DUF2220 family protein [Methanocalculus sp.]